MIVNKAGIASVALLKTLQESGVQRRNDPGRKRCKNAIQEHRNEIINVDLPMHKYGKGEGPTLMYYLVLTT